MQSIIVCKFKKGVFMIGMNMINNCNAYSNYNHNVNFCGGKDKCIKQVPRFYSEAKNLEEEFALWLQQHKHLTDRSLRGFEEPDLILVKEHSSIGLDPSIGKLGGFRSADGTEYKVCWEPKEVKSVVNYIGGQPYYATFKPEISPDTLRRSTIMDQYNLG